MIVLVKHRCTIKNFSTTIQGHIHLYKVKVNLPRRKIEIDLYLVKMGHIQRTPPEAVPLNGRVAIECVGKENAMVLKVYEHDEVIK